MTIVIVSMGSENYRRENFRGEICRSEHARIQKNKVGVSAGLIVIEKII